MVDDADNECVVQLSQQSTHSLQSKERKSTRHVVQKIHLLKEPGKGLGVQLSGSERNSNKKGVFITHVIRDGAAYRDGRIKENDELLWINGCSLIGKSYQEATEMLSSSTALVQLVISRKSEGGILSSSSKKSWKQNRKLRQESMVTSDVNHSLRVKKIASALSFPGSAKLTTKNKLMNLKFKMKKVEVEKTDVDIGLGMTVRCLPRDVYSNSIETCVIIDAIMEGGCVSRANCLQKGDQLLEVNGKSMDSLSTAEVIKMFEDLPTGINTLLIKENPYPSNKTPSTSFKLIDNGIVFAVTLQKEYGRGLGIGVARAADKTTPGIFVQQIAANSVAAEDDKLRCGDQILEVNNTCLRYATLTDAFTVLASLSPGNVHLLIKRIQHLKSEPITPKPNTDVSQEEIPFEAPEMLLDLMTPAVVIGHNFGARRNSVISNVDSDDSYWTLYDDVSIASVPHKQSSADVHVLCNPPDYVAIDNQITSTVTKSQESWIHSSPISPVDDDASSIGNVDVVRSFHCERDNTIDNQQVNIYSTENIYNVCLDRELSGTFGLNVRIEKSNNPSVEHNGVFVKAVLCNSASDGCTGIPGGLVTNDEILSVNDHDLSTLDPRAVQSIIKHMPPVTKLVIRRCQNNTANPTSNHLQTSSVSVQSKDSFSSQTMPNSIARSDPNERPAALTIRRRSVLPDMISAPDKPCRPLPVIHDHHSSSGTDSTHSSEFETKNNFKNKTHISLLPSPASPTPSHLSNSHSFSSFPSNDAVEHRSAIPLPGYIPNGLESVYVKVNNPQRKPLGLSLLTSNASLTKGFVQIRRIQPGSVCDQAESSIRTGDFVYSVNGHGMKNVSHPAAIQILKAAADTVSTNFVLLRKPSLDKCKAKSKQGIERSVSMEVPQVVIGESTVKNGKETLLSGASIDSSPVVPNRKISSTRILRIPSASDTNVPPKIVETSVGLTRRQSDRSTTSNDSNRSSISENDDPLFGSRLEIGKRSTMCPFLIEYQKGFRPLGIKILIDENSDIVITEITPTGIVGRDTTNSIRLGDVLISINGVRLSGKPLSKVEAILKNVSRGVVKLIAVSPNTTFNCLDNGGTSKQMIGIVSPPPVFVDNESDGENLPPAPAPPCTFPAYYDSTSDNDSVTMTLAPVPPRQYESLDETSIHYNVSDTESTSTVLPPAPPHPNTQYVLSLKYDNSSDFESVATTLPPAPAPPSYNNESDNESVATALPPPPERPLHSIALQAPNQAHDYTDYEKEASIVPLQMDSYMFATPRILSHEEYEVQATEKDAKKRTLFDKLIKKLKTTQRSKAEDQWRSQDASYSSQIKTYGTDQPLHLNPNVSKLKRAASFDNSSLHCANLSHSSHRSCASSDDSSLTGSQASASLISKCDRQLFPAPFTLNNASSSTSKSSHSSSVSTSAQSGCHSNTIVEKQQRGSVASLLHFEFPPPPPSTGSETDSVGGYATIEEMQVTNTTTATTNGGVEERMCSRSHNSNSGTYESDWGSEFSSCSYGHSNGLQSARSSTTEVDSQSEHKEGSMGDQEDGPRQENLSKSSAMVNTEMQQTEPIYARIDKTRKRSIYKPSSSSNDDFDLLPTTTESDNDDNLDEGQLFLVKLVREPGRRPLGITVVGGYDTLLHHLYVKSVLDGTVAAKSNSIQRGDRLISINGNKLKGATQSTASDLLSNSPPLIELVLWRGDLDIDLLLSDSTDSGPSLLNYSSILEAATITSHVPKQCDALVIQHNPVQTASPMLHNREVKEMSTFKIEPVSDQLPFFSAIDAEEFEEWETFEVEIKKTGKKGLGIGVSGNSTTVLSEGLTVRRLLDDGLAAQDGQLECGDRITSVNGRSLRGLERDQALKILKDAPKRVELNVSRRVGKSIREPELTNLRRSIRGSERRLKTRSMASSSTKYAINYNFAQLKRTRPVSIHKDSNFDFGLELEGGESGVYGSTPLLVKKIKEGCVIEGKVKVGDEICFINRKDIDGMSREEAMVYLKSQPKGVINIDVIDTKKR